MILPWLKFRIKLIHHGSTKTNILYVHERTTACPNNPYRVLHGHLLGKFDWYPWHMDWSKQTNSLPHLKINIFISQRCRSHCDPCNVIKWHFLYEAWNNYVNLLTLSGHGDECDLSAEDRQDSRGWGSPRNAGSRGQHRGHQSGT